MKIKFPEKYIERGKKKLHSGGTSEIFYNVRKIVTDEAYFNLILNNIPFSPHYVGIRTAGADIAIAIHARHFKSKLSIVEKDPLILIGDKPTGDWMLIDDVVTTGSSLLEAISLVGSQPKEIYVAVDRRERNENPRVTYSCFEAQP